MAAKGSVGRVTRASTLLDPDDVMRERAISLKHSRSGHLGALTTVQREIEALLTDPANITLARDKLERYETLWKGFVDSHSKFMEVACDEERAQPLSNTMIYRSKGFACLQLWRNLFVKQLLNLTTE